MWYLGKNAKEKTGGKHKRTTKHKNVKLRKKAFKGQRKNEPERQSARTRPSAAKLGSTLLNFGDRTRTGVFSVIWQLTIDYYFLGGGHSDTG